MAWNLDYSMSLTNFPQSADSNRLLAGSGKIVWALMMHQNGSVHSLHAFDIIDSYQSLPDANEDLGSSRTGYIAPFKSFTSIGYGTAIATDGDTAYVGIGLSPEGTTFARIDVFRSWGVQAGSITTPVYMNSNIVIDNGSLWMSSYDINNNGEQELYRYNLTTKEWSKVGIPVRHQTEVRFLSRDHNGHILSCDYNNLSITKFTNVGAFVSTTRLAASAAGANRQPNYITIGDDRSVYIASFQGMISTFNPTTDAVASFSNGLGDVHSFVDDGTYLWVASKKRPMSVSYQGANYTCYESHMAGPTFDVEKWAAGGDGAAGAWAAGNYYVDDTEDLIRIRKSNNQIRHFGSTDRDIQIENPPGVELAGTKVNSVLVTPALSCATTDGVVSVPKHIWAITADNNLVAFPITAMHRPNFYQMNAVAMMSFGPYDYIGE